MCRCFCNHILHLTVCETKLAYHHTREKLYLRYFVHFCLTFGPFPEPFPNLVCARLLWLHGLHFKLIDWLISSDCVIVARALFLMFYVIINRPILPLILLSSSPRTLISVLNSKPAFSTTKFLYHNISGLRRTVSSK